tara:strand:+ start:1021 stop:1623 length:603 start_codon:yes stop_codon:yes gene_type:complete
MNIIPKQTLNRNCGKFQIKYNTVTMIHYFKGYIPLQKFKELGLKPGQSLVVTTILGLCKQDGYAKISAATIARDFNLNPKTAQNWLTLFVDLGLFKLKSGFKTREANQYSPTVKLKNAFKNDQVNNTNTQVKNNSSDQVKKSQDTLPKGRGELVSTDPLSFRKESHWREVYEKYIADGITHNSAVRYADTRIKQKPKQTV